MLVAGTSAATLLWDTLSGQPTNDPWGGIERHISIYDVAQNTVADRFYSYAHDANDGHQFEGRVAFPARSLLPVAGAFQSRIVYSVYSQSSNRWVAHVSQVGGTSDQWIYDNVHVWGVVDIDGDGGVELVTSPTTGYFPSWQTDVVHLDVRTGALIPLRSYPGYLPYLTATFRHARRTTHGFLYPLLVTEENGVRRVVLRDPSGATSSQVFP